MVGLVRLLCGGDHPWAESLKSARFRVCFGPIGVPDDWREIRIMLNKRGFLRPDQRQLAQTSAKTNDPRPGAGIGTFVQGSGFVNSVRSSKTVPGAVIGY